MSGGERINKFKEWLYSKSNLDYIDPLIVVKEYEKYHPPTIKLSEIVERLKKDVNDPYIYYNKDLHQIGCDYYLSPKDKYFVPYVFLEDNKIDDFGANLLRDREANIDWLYQLKLDQTEIIIDEVKE